MKHIHFIGICGVGMGALAVLWQKKGWLVTGSDVGFYPPVSTHLTKHNIKYYAGWHPEKIGALPPPLNLPLGQGETARPDLVVVGNVAGSQNPELKFVLKNNIPYLSYPELIEQNLIKTNSIVCAGTYAKTTTTALLAKILIDAKFNPAYMFGAVATDLDLSADDRGGQYSIIGGDEYKTSRTDPSAKFFHYHSTHLLLTSATWDHADVYPTEKLYLEAFKKLIAQLPKNGLLVVSEKALSVIPNPRRGEKSPSANSCDNGDPSLDAWNDKKLRIVTYGANTNCDYQYTDVLSTKSGLTFKIKHQSETAPRSEPSGSTTGVYNLKSEILGDYMADNICGAFALAESIGIAPQQIIASVKNFHGIKRRLENRGTTTTGATVFDDIAHSPTKAQAVLKSLKQIYSGKIIAIFEPNTGNRELQSVPAYANAFNNATEVVIPRLTKIKTTIDSKHLNGEELSKIIKNSQPNTKYIGDDEKLVEYIKDNTGPDDCAVFLGSHGWRGMIEELLK